MLIPSQACPASCAYCFGPHQGGPVMQRATLQTVIRRQNSLDSNRALDITFHGGEPLVPGAAFYREALPLLRHGLSTRQISFSIQSNLCNHGTLDSLTYWLDRGWSGQHFFAYTGTNRAKHDQHYAAVIHLVTAARRQ